MKVFSISILVWTDDEFNERKPDLDMIKALVKEKIPTGKIEEKVFRQSVVANILAVEIYGRQVRI